MCDHADTRITDAMQSVHNLPPEHAGYLTRVAGADNLAVVAQYVPLHVS